MPYIDQKRRAPLLLSTVDTVGLKCETAGELNFVLTSICLAALRRHGKSYATLNSIRGALHDVHDEFYRRLVAPYEDQKKEENGDVYP